MKTQGLISSLCFVEIKTHQTKLLMDGKAYRSECWRISDELSGALSQIQKSAYKATKKISSQTSPTDSDGNPTGENVFLYAPKSYIVIGSFEQFSTAKGVNEEKYSSFEIFRRHLVNTEVITFDELYMRAQGILNANQELKVN